MDVTGETGVADLNPGPVTDFDASGLDPRPVDKGAVATAQVLDVVLSLCWKQELETFLCFHVGHFIAIVQKVPYYPQA